MSRKTFSVVGVIIALVLLAAVRYLQAYVFYDPLESYFHDNFQALPIPDSNLPLLLLSNGLRYLVNGCLSLAIIALLFKAASYFKASLWVYAFAFVLLNIVFVISYQFDTDLSKMVLFYSRRFIIHPLLLFILVAGGYFLKVKNEQVFFKGH